MLQEKKQVRVKPGDYHRVKALVVEYTAALPPRRREILQELNTLTFPLLRSWNVWDKDNRADLEQDAYLVLVRALETYKLGPGRGGELFLRWLRGYYNTLNRDARLARGKQALVSDGIDQEEAAPENPPDHVFWARLRERLSDEEWSVLEARYLQGHDTAEIAEKLGLSRRSVQMALKAIGDKVRLFMALSGPSLLPGKFDFGDGEPQWLTRNQLLARLPITREYLKLLLTPGTSKAHCPQYIDPADTFPIQGTLIRYLETAEKGIIFPRLKVKRERLPQVRSVNHHQLELAEA